MDVTFLGQAGLYIETKAGSILCDPWFNPAFFGAWYPFPANDGIDPERIGHPTYLYVSHLHHDHFDPRFLAQHVSKEATVLLPDYPLDKLEQELTELGFRTFIKTRDGEPFELPGGLRAMIMALVAPTDGPIGDSALLLDDGEVRLLDMNDARPTDPDKLLALGPIDAHFLQFSGAIWYPMVYEFPEKAIEVLAHKKRVAQLARAYRYIELIDPRVVVPSAGPPCFLDDDLFAFNDLHGDPSNIFPDQPTFIEYVRSHETERPQGPYDARLMLPGSVMRLDAAGAEVRHPLLESEIEAIFARKADYLGAYQARMRPRIEAERAAWAGPRLDLVAELKAWFEPLLEEADLICGGINDAILLDLGDEGIVIDFVGREVRAWDGLAEPRYTFRIDRHLVEACVRRHLVDWVNELFLSMRFRARRRGAYNDYVYTWWKCLSEERLQYAEGFYAERGPSQGTWEACGYRIQARCPHMKADLTRFATIEDGVLTCALHGWQFELDGGRCLTADGHQLWTQPIEAGLDTPEEAAEAAS
ncbi:MAG: Rieske 2Fe-2S domain-containing protein [Candidatus Limnocylindrales bacterium]